MRRTYLDTICEENKMKRAIVPYQVTIQGLFTQHHFHLKRDFFFSFIYTTMGVWESKNANFWKQVQVLKKNKLYLWKRRRGVCLSCVQS